MRNKHWSVLSNALLTLVSLIVISSSAHATIFKCVNTQGAIYYNDKPCPKDNEETKIKATKDPKGGYKSFYANKDEKNKTSSSGSIRKNEKNGTKKAKDIKKPSRAKGQDASNNHAVTSSESAKKGSASSNASDSPSAIDSTKDRDLSVVIPSHLFH